MNQPVIHMNNNLFKAFDISRDEKIQKSQTNKLYYNIMCNVIIIIN